MKFRALVLPLVVLALPAVLPAVARPWTNSDGKTIEADFVSADGQVVRFRIKGKVTSYPLEKLSQADRDWVAAQSADSGDDGKQVNAGYASDMKAFLQEIDKTYPGISFIPGEGDTVMVLYPPADLQDKLPTGTIVTKFNGQNAREHLDAEAAKSWKDGGCFSSPQRARLFAYRIPLTGKEGEKHTIHCLVRGREKKFKLTCTREVSGWPHSYHLPEDLQEGRNTCIRRAEEWLGERAGLD